jgi:hypothetical protein
MRSLRTEHGGQPGAFQLDRHAAELKKNGRERVIGRATADVRDS